MTLGAESFKSELAKISELRNKRIKNSKNVLLLKTVQNVLNSKFSTSFD